MPSKRHCAAELEYSSGDATTLHGWCRTWRGGAIQHDGSLPEGGFEIITPPCSGDKFAECIDELCDNLIGDINTSCGYHVHVDCRDLGYWDIRRVIRLYAKIEDALFSIVPPSRRENSYCVKCADELLVPPGRAALKEYLGGSTSGRVAAATLKRDSKPHMRYKALNLCSYYYRGTIECRLAAGTTSADKIINWAALWAGIIDTADRLPEKAIDALEPGISTLISCQPSLETWIRSRKEAF